MKIRRGQAGSRPGNFWIGCLVVVVLAIIALVIGGWYAMANWRGWASDGARSIFNDAIAQVDLPDDQKIALEAEVSGLIDSFEAGDLSLAELGQITAEFSESPLLPAAIVMGFNESYYADNEELTDEQKTESRKQISRFVNGITSEEIAQTKIDDTFEPISSPTGEVDINAQTFRVRLKLPENTTPDELMAVIDNMRDQADEADIEDKEFVVDIAAEFTKVVDAALDRTPALPEAPHQPEEADGDEDDEGDD